MLLHNNIKAVFKIKMVANTAWVSMLDKGFIFIGYFHIGRAIYFRLLFLMMVLAGYYFILHHIIFRQYYKSEYNTSSDGLCFSEFDVDIYYAKLLSASIFY